MKVIILSKGRPETISTHKLFEREGLDYTLVLHTAGERQSYIDAGFVSPEKIVVSNAPFGVSHQRQWIQDNLIPKGDWYISLDDNIRSFQCVPEPLYSQHSLPVQGGDKKAQIELKDAFETECSTKRFLEVCEGMHGVGEKEKAYNLGFGTTPNFYFRGKKFRFVGYVISKAVIRKNLGIPFELTNQSMEDYAYTAENLLRYGKVLINNYCFPVAGHYEKGGIGTYKERAPAKVRDSAFLMLKYPGLFRYKVKKGCDPKAEIQIRFTTLKQVEMWRALMRNKYEKNTD
jgi:hypothetical protein